MKALVQAKSFDALECFGSTSPLHQGHGSVAQGTRNLVDRLRLRLRRHVNPRETGIRVLEYIAQACLSVPFQHTLHTLSAQNKAHR